MDLLIAQNPRRPQAWAQEDDGVVLKNFFLEQEEGCAAASAVQSLPWTARFPTSGLQHFTYGEISAQLKNFWAEQEEGCQASSARQTVAWFDTFPISNQQHFTDDEIQSGLKNFWKEQEEGCQSAFAEQTIAWQPRPFLDDEFQAGLANFFLEQEEPTASASAEQTIAWIARPFLDDEFQAGLKNFFLEQEEPANSARQSLIWYSLTFTDDHQLPVAVVLPTVDDESLQPLVQRVQPWASWQARDDETAPAVPLEDESALIAPVRLQPWLSTALIADDEIAVFRIDDEPGVGAATQQRQTWQSLAFTADSVIVPSVAPVGLDDEAAWPQLRQSIRWTIWPAILGMWVGEEGQVKFVPYRAINLTGRVDTAKTMTGRDDSRRSLSGQDSTKKTLGGA